MIGVPGRVDYEQGALEYAPNLPPGWVTSLSRQYLSDRGLRGDAQDVLLRVTGDPAAEQAWAMTKAAACATLVNLSHLFCPDRMVVGGGLGLHAPGLVQAGAAAVAARGPRGVAVPIAVRTAELGDDAGLAGAAAWTHDLVIRSR